MGAVARNHGTGIDDLIDLPVVPVLAFFFFFLSVDLFVVHIQYLLRLVCRENGVLIRRKRFFVSINITEPPNKFRSSYRFVYKYSSAKGDTGSFTNKENHLETVTLIYRKAAKAENVAFERLAAFINNRLVFLL
jgi:hypothetical protein